MQKLKTEGKCFFCKKTFAKADIARHLKPHFANLAKTSKKGKSFFLKVETSPQFGTSVYFLYLLLSDKAKMNDLDLYLRKIWLECCGHMSNFRDKLKVQKRGGMFDFFETQNLLAQGKNSQHKKLIKNYSTQIPKSKDVSKVFYYGQKLVYEYDFGSTTQLLISVMDVFEFERKTKITLLSRNNPLELLCNSCKTEPATEICTIHNYDEDSLFCPECAKKHAKKCPDFNDYASMPVVNSPRMGVCGYTGGKIDIKRDGVFVIE